MDVLAYYYHLDYHKQSYERSRREHVVMTALAPDSEEGRETVSVLG